jgi:putative membrane protein
MGNGIRLALHAYLLVLIILGVVYLVKLIVGGEKRTTGETALDILEKRYAKGEINKEEFEEKKKDLTGS